MAAIERAIKEAKRGGWKPKKDWHYEDRSNFGIKNIIWELDRCFLDPLFWQALGSARGWEDDSDGSYGEWYSHSRSFFTHLRVGRDAESFFQTLV